jgi:endogenous inhibitor of DNA gyrase (YacG/DUF329 family)
MDDFNYVSKCPKCGKHFKVYETEQTPGFRFPEDMICPYCGEVVKTSMEFEYTTYEID